MENKKQKLDNVDNYDNEYKNYGIHMLNEDCLTHIFQFLPIADRVRIERVCKQWQETVKGSWRHFRVLEFSQKSWGSFKPGVPDNNVFKKVLRRCHLSLTHIIARDYYMTYQVNNIHLIPKWCPNLEYAILNTFTLTTPFLRELRLCTKIKEISVEILTRACTDDVLGSLVSSLKNLRSIKIRSPSIRFLDWNKKLCGRFLLMANAESIQEVYFDRRKYVDVAAVCRIIENFKNLHTLTFRRLNIEPAHLLLKSLRLLHIRTLDISLTFYDEGINDDFLSELKDACKSLVVLNVSGNKAITDAGLTSIAALPNLEELDISALSNISTIQMLCTRSTLKKLYCKNTGINNHDVMLLSSVEKIEYLDLKFCRNISKGFFYYLELAINLRDNDIIVTIVLTNTQITVTDLPTISRVKFKI